MREPYWGYYNEEELQEWFDMWEEQLYYEENVFPHINKQEGNAPDHVELKGKNNET